MKSEIKIILRFAFAFFIMLSVTVFLINILHLVLENTTDIVTTLLVVCGFCFILISFIYDRVKIPADELFNMISKSETS